VSFAPAAGALPLNAVAPAAAAPMMMAKSKALPFLESPPACDGTMAGDVGFDPLGLSSYYSIKWMREAEIKHGRICQLAWLGWLTTDAGIYAPGAPQVSSLAAHDATVKSGHMLLLLFVIAIPEALSYVAISEMMSGETDREPGDYGIGWKLCKADDTATQQRYKEAEVAHCRAAMLAFSGVVTQSALNEMSSLPYF